jgi:RND family efflux transporter MFP subunit
MWLTETSLMGAKSVLLAVAFGAAALAGAHAYWPQVGPHMPAQVHELIAMLPPEYQPKGAGKPETAPKPATPSPAARGPGQGPRVVPVSLGMADRRPMPVRFDTIGQVQPLASVTVRSRVESQVLSVAFEDGSQVKKGDILFQLDQRGIEAQIKQAEATLARSRAQLEQAQRDVKRNEALAANEYASRQKLDDSKTSVSTLQAQIRSDEAVLENLNVSLSYYTIRAPISGRVGVAGVKAGNIAKTGDSSVALATINQMSPIYVSFAVPQRLLPELRTALAQGTSKVQATPQGTEDAIDGKVAVIENAVDAASGTVTLRGIFENADEILWPSALCNVRLVIRTEPDAVVVPKEAVQTSQNGTIVFVVKDNIARVRPVVVDRTLRGLSVIKSGLEGNETVVTDGQLMLTEGTRVEPKGDGGTRPGAPPARPAPPAAGANVEAKPTKTGPGAS